MYTEYNYLMHHGVKGQKWGVRRYQNPNGTLTAKGKKKYLDKNGNLNKKGDKAFGQRLTEDARLAGVNALKPYLSTAKALNKEYGNKQYRTPTLYDKQWNLTAKGEEFRKRAYDKYHSLTVEEYKKSKSGKMLSNSDIEKYIKKGGMVDMYTSPSDVYDFETESRYNPPGRVSYRR